MVGGEAKDHSVRDRTRRLDTAVNGIRIASRQGDSNDEGQDGQVGEIVGS